MESIPAPHSPSDPQISFANPSSSPCDVNGPQVLPEPSPDSPPRPSSPSSTLNNMSYRAGELDSAAAHDHHRRSPYVSSSSSTSAVAPSGRLPRLLPLDVSAYSDPYLPSSALTTSSISLSELAHLIRLQRHTEQRRSQSRVRLHRWLVSAALSARLLHCGQSAYRTLVDYFRTDNKKDFTILHSALHDVSSSCDATRRYALLEPDLGNSKSKPSANSADASATFSTFMHEIPSKTRLEILAFISEIRTNPDFLAARIASLSENELLALTSFRPSPNESAVLASGKFGQKKGLLTPTASPVERLLSLHRHDSLSALIYTVFANSSGPDSPEDVRRTDAWAVTCGRLILENRPGWERFIPRVLDVWSEMRDWPVKDNLELYLMQVLQEGQFLLEKAESGPGRPGSIADKLQNNKPLEYATEEFFSRSVKNLMTLVDGDPFAGGLPEGILEIGHAIISKLRPSKKHCRIAETFILVHWFFGSFLYQALIYPETHGIMVGYHIPQLARDRILKEIASRTRRQILAIFNNIGSSVVVMPEVKKHIDNLFDRLRRPKSHGKPILVPARAITSPKETVEVQPFLVLSPADIVTLVTSLFPERKLNPYAGKDLQNGKLASAASSISGISIPGLGTMARDGSSILSQSVSSMTSDATSRDQPADYFEQQDHIDLPIEQREAALVRPVPTEEYGRKLRDACSEMSRVLGSDAVTGTCHPCADRWAVLHVSSDGRELLTRMRKDVEGDEGHDEDSPDSDSEDESSSYGVPLENDYHQLKESIVKLLSEFELPKVLSDSTAFSNGQSPRRERRNKRRTSAQPDPSPTHQSHQSTGQISSMVANQRYTSSRTRRSSNTGDNEDTPKTSDLVIMLDAAYQQCQSRNEFVDAHIWYRTLEQLKKLSSPSLTKDGYGPLLHYFGRGPRDSLARCFSAIDEFEAWFVWLKQSQERHESRVDTMMRTFKNLRDKMWYKTAVVTSAGYDEARNIAIALKLMGKKLNPGEVMSKPVPFHRRTFSRPSITATANFLLKTEAQVLDLIAASNDHGGPNKLSDEQVELTLKWLRDCNIERNFCQCEERIHRFNLEIDKCVNKLVADSVIDGPVLWSSELYRRDREILDRGRSDVWLIGFGLCIPDHEADEEKSRQPSRKSLDFPQQPSKDSLRSLSTQGSQSYASSDWSSGTKAASLNIIDAQDYFGGSSPARDIDSNVTFWSPFQTSSSQGSSTATKDSRPVSAASAKSLQTKTPAALADEKRRFLLDLKRTLTGLLLSDLGMLVFNSGSETDSWFSESIVDECIKLKDADDRKRRQKLAKKKSKRALKASRDHQKSSSQTANGSERTSPILTDDDDSKKSYLEFPYHLAYKGLLQRFSTHPNPFAKLEALYNLRILIEHQLSSPYSRPFGNAKSRRDDQPTPRDSPKPSTPTTATRSGRGSPSAQSRTRVAISHSPPSTNAVIEVLQSLFCDPTIRPKTLFRDLQYIAAFVPPETLDKSAQGKAFCDASVAAVGLKDDIVRYMVEIADRIVEEDTEGRSMGPALAGSSQSGQSPSATVKDSVTATTTMGTGTDASPAAEATAAAAAGTTTTTTPQPPRYTMTDAAHIYHLAAREGNAAAERELAIFYLTQPDITPRVMQPLAKPKDVFKNLDKMLSQRARGGSKGEKDDSKRSDPLTLCLAHHWMEMSKAGGDELAANYLRDRDDIERIPGA